MPETNCRRAIVIGGSLSGLLASRVLADYFDRVTLLERDRYPTDPEPRCGVSQVRHAHLLLTRGKQILEHLFPGLSVEMVKNGASVVEIAKELAVLSYYGWRVRYHGGPTVLTFTRPLLDWCIRRRLVENTPIRLVDGGRVTDLVADAERNHVTGVRCRFSDDSRGQQVLHAELVVDASGRFSRTPEWLSALGYDRPKETVVDPFLGYASRLYKPPASFQADWTALLIMGKPPDKTRGGVLLPVEGGRWLVTLAGIGKDYPPIDEVGFLEFARTLRSSILHKAIKDARPLSSIVSYRATENRRRHYESLVRWPGRFVVLGDAVCAFNPIYAQGMSVVALGAMTLAQCLRKQDLHSGNSTGFARRFQQELAKVNAMPWLMATGDDFRWPLTEGGRPGLLTRFMHRYLDAVIALATEHPEVDRLLSQVLHLLAPPRVLLHPRIAIRVLAQALHLLPTQR